MQFKDAAYELLKEEGKRFSLQQNYRSRLAERYSGYFRGHSARHKLNVSKQERTLWDYDPGFFL